MASATVTCPGCGRPGAVELQMKVKGGQELTMLSCNQCDARSWLADGSPLSRAEVLKLTSGDPDFIHAPRERAGRKGAAAPATG